MSISAYPTSALPSDNLASWCYLRLSPRKVKQIQTLIDKSFRTFVYNDSSIGLIGKKKQEKRSASVMSGFLFVQGTGSDVQAFLHQEALDLYVARDCATRSYASISANMMDTFINLSRTSGCTIYFIQKEYEEYAKENTLVHVHTGILQGLEGYIVRFHRDRLLVVRLANNLTVALTGIHKCTFESMQDVRIAQDMGLISTNL